MFSARALDVGVSGKRLLSAVQLQVGPGEIVATVGPSGCGKTTLLRTLAGLIDPLAGQLTLDGQEPSAIGWARYRRRVMLVTQRAVLFEGSVAANLERPFAYASAEGAVFEAAEAASLLERVGLPEAVLEQSARELSEGQAQRVALVRALLLQPTVMLMDEPTSALDAESRGLVEQLLQSFDGGVVLVSHDADQVDRLAQRTLDLTAHRVEA